MASTPAHTNCTHFRPVDCLRPAKALLRAAAPPAGFEPATRRLEDVGKAFIEVCPRRLGLPDQGFYTPTNANKRLRTATTTATKPPGSPTDKRPARPVVSPGLRVGRHARSISQSRHMVAPGRKGFNSLQPGHNGLSTGWLQPQRSHSGQYGPLHRWHQPRSRSTPGHHSQKRPVPSRRARVAR